MKNYSSGDYDPTTGFTKLRCCHWFTNLKFKDDREPFELTKHYNPADYPKYDNYDAIEVGRVKDIPIDYDGVMGVPVTFLNKYNPDQFEIVGMTESLDRYNLKIKNYTKADLPDVCGGINAQPWILVDGKLKPLYTRILIRRAAQEE